MWTTTAASGNKAVLQQQYARTNIARRGRWRRALSNAVLSSSSHRHHTVDQNNPTTNTSSSLASAGSLSTIGQHYDHQQKRFSSLMATAASPYHLNQWRRGDRNNNSNTTPSLIQPNQQLHHFSQHPALQSHYRLMSTSPSSSSWIPEVFQDFSIWGASGWMLTHLHQLPNTIGLATDDTTIPYWACFALTNVLVRVALLPVVVYGAHTAARFAKVMPEVQFLVTVFQNDMKLLQQQKASAMERWQLMRLNLKSLGLIYKGYQIHPFSVFASPLLQIPIFYYVSVDLRKIVNGLDPNLAQDLVESSLAWVPDLTEPDPWFGLPILAGAMLYLNVEVAMGRRNLAGQAASKANTAVLLKDIFQSFAIFMPCFTANLPAGIQIYLVTTFAFTMVQSELLRTAAFRSVVGLPPLPEHDAAAADAAQQPPEVPKYAKLFLRLRQLEHEAIQQRGDGPLLGVGVLKSDYQGSFAGTARPSSIVGSGNALAWLSSQPPSKTIQQEETAEESATISGTDSATTSVDNKNNPQQDRDTIAMENLPFGKLPFVHGVSAPLWQQQEQAPQFWSPEQVAAMTGTALEDESESTESSQESKLARQEELIEKANRGEPPVATQFVDTRPKSPEAAPKQPSLKRFQRKARQQQQQRRKKKR